MLKNRDTLMAEIRANKEVYVTNDVKKTVLQLIQDTTNKYPDTSQIYEVLVKLKKDVENLW
jgi:hypothetical protein|tara:strand:+ start:76 stop:258 length:183 start_codon:yes stop_codon:yes gene_type:complete